MGEEKRASPTCGRQVEGMRGPARVVIVARCGAAARIPMACGVGVRDGIGCELPWQATLPLDVVSS